MPSFKPNLSVTLTVDQERLWSNSIGGLILNFGAIEFQSHRWIQHFAMDPVLGDIAIDMPFSRRVSLILALIERSILVVKVRQQAIEKWNEIKKLSEIRNTIAHNPIIFAPGPSGQISAGIPSVKRMKGAGPFEITLLDVSQIVTTALRLREIAAELELLLSESAEATDTVPT